MSFRVDHTVKSDYSDDDKSRLVLLPAAVNSYVEISQIRSNPEI